MPTSKYGLVDLIPGDETPVAEFSEGELSPEVFWHDRVCRHRPVVVRGAACHWPAIEKWTDPGYLERSCQPEDVTSVGTSFNSEPAAPLKRFVPLREWLPRVRRASPSATHAAPSVSLPAAWLADLGAYSFSRAPWDRRPRDYPRDRLFIYRNASTEWHYHPADETLTTQLVGSKTLGMFRLDGPQWARYRPLLQANAHHLPTDGQIWGERPRLEKHTVTLEPGDALYIPPFWWHAADPADAELGVTLARCFASPLRRVGSLVDPAVREDLTERMNPRLILAGHENPWSALHWLGLVAAGSALRAMRGEPWRNDA